MILIDSDILIWILRNNDEYINKFRKTAKDHNGHIFITPIQHLEIMAGTKDKEKINTEIFLDSLGTINIDKTAGKLAGEFMRIFNKSHSVQSADAMVAAVAKLHDLKLWTNNKKHFPMLKKSEFLE
jgi:predicted nucleic acid-binding protein